MTTPPNQPDEGQAELALDGPKVETADQPIAQPEKLQLAREAAAYLNSLCK